MPRFASLPVQQSLTKLTGLFYRLFEKGEFEWAKLHPVMAYGDTNLAFLYNPMRFKMTSDTINHAVIV